VTFVPHRPGSRLDDGHRRQAQRAFVGRSFKAEPAHAIAATKLEAASGEDLSDFCGDGTLQS
jgi:hypothetical protein